MGDFSAAWLARREPVDRAARSQRITAVIARALQDARDVSVLDLGSGTGSNLRYLAPRLPRPQRWLLVDRDADLLAQADAQHLRGAPLAIERREMDLVRIGDASSASLFEGRALVTASALLDLVSEAWIVKLAELAARAGAAALFALTYDGRIACTPGDRDDATIRRLVNEHQRHDKGFGPALGPAAATVAARAFAAHGYGIEQDRSDWILTTADRAIQQELIDGWARAALESASQESAAIEAWRTRRLAHVAAGRSQIAVGHQDLAATFK